MTLPAIASNVAPILRRARDAAYPAAPDGEARRKLMRAIGTVAGLADRRLGRDATARELAVAGLHPPEIADVAANVEAGIARAIARQYGAAA
jgi:hypothetical protein